MRMVDVYLAKAAEFEALPLRFDEASAKKPYLDMADTYRLLAEKRRREYRRQEAG